jgi:hypothetical protein
MAYKWFCPIGPICLEPDIKEVTKLLPELLRVVYGYADDWENVEYTIAVIERGNHTDELKTLAVVQALEFILPERIPSVYSSIILAGDFRVRWAVGSAVGSGFVVRYKNVEGDLLSQKFRPGTTAVTHFHTADHDALNIRNTKSYDPTVYRWPPLPETLKVRLNVRCSWIKKHKNPEFIDHCGICMLNNKCENTCVYRCQTWDKHEIAPCGACGAPTCITCTRKCKSTTDMSNWEKECSVICVKCGHKCVDPALLEPDTKFWGLLKRIFGIIE